MSEIISLENILWTIAVFSTVFYVLKLLVVMLVGGDIEVDADFDSITEVETSFTFLSVQSVLAFLMGFGWCGISAMIQFKLPWVITMFIAFIAGMLCMFVSAYLMFSIKKLNKKVIIELKELEGKEGKAYTTFEPKSGGQIEINLNNKLTILNAESLSDEKIEAFSQIKVEKVENNIVYIVKI